MRKRSIILAVLGIAAVGLAVAFFCSTIEPAADGHSLSYWLDVIDQPHRHPHPPIPNQQKKFDQAAAAFQKMGARAVPTLLRMMRATNSPLQNSLMALAAKQHFFNFHLLAAGDMNYEAWHGFGMLGTNAFGAVPVLVEIYEQNRSGMSRKCSASSLEGMGPAAATAVPALLQVATNTNANTSYLGDRGDAIGALGEIHSAPQIGVPALTNCLTDPTVFSFAVTALGKFHEDASVALPLLFGLLSDSNKMVRLNAVEAIKQIAPAEAERRKPELDAVLGP